jgi:hypothetical protein
MSMTLPHGLPQRPAPRSNLRAGCQAQPTTIGIEQAAIVQLRAMNNGTFWGSRTSPIQP